MTTAAPSMSKTASFRHCSRCDTTMCSVCWEASAAIPEIHGLSSEVKRCTYSPCAWREWAGVSPTCQCECGCNASGEEKKVPREEKKKRKPEEKKEEKKKPVKKAKKQEDMTLSEIFSRVSENNQEALKAIGKEWLHSEILEAMPAFVDGLLLKLFRDHPEIADASGETEYDIDLLNCDEVTGLIGTALEKANLKSLGKKFELEKEEGEISDDEDEDDE